MSIEGLRGCRALPRLRLSGFQDKNRLRTVVKGSIPSVGIELRHDSTESTNFTMFSVGEHLDLPCLQCYCCQRWSNYHWWYQLHDMGGSTFGSLNLVSGSLLLGGTAGSTIAENGGVISVLSKGGTHAKNIFADSPDGGSSTSVISNITFSGNITDDMVMICDKVMTVIFLQPRNEENAISLVECKQ